MPTVYALLPDQNPHWHKSDGTLASGYQLFVYAAGGTTKATTYRDSDGLVANTNPIILDSRGEPPHGIYVETGTYKWVLAPDTDTDPPSSAIDTRDDITPINDVANAVADEWTESGLTPTYVSGTQFTLAGDQTTEFHEGRRLRITDSGGTDYGTITASSYSSLTTITVSLDSGSIDSGISAVDYSILSADNSTLPHIISDSDGLTIDSDLKVNGALQLTKGADVASASNLLINIDGNFFDVTGTTTIDTLASKGVGSFVVLQFDAALTLAYDATDLILPGGENITTVAGDIAMFHEYASGDWRLVSYQRSTQPVAQFPQFDTSITDLTNSGSDDTAVWDLTGIPSWARTVEVLIEGASLSGTEDIYLLLGDSGGIETSGYRFGWASSTAGLTDSTSEFRVGRLGGASRVIDICITLRLFDPSTNTWMVEWTGGDGVSDNTSHGSGSKALSGALSQVRIKSSGTDNFDGGNARLRWF